MSGMIKSLADQDLYKFGMSQIVLHQFPATEVEYEFRCRNKGIDFRSCVTQIIDEIEKLKDLSFSAEELEFISGLSWVKPDYIQFLKLLRLDPKMVDIDTDESGGLQIKIKGPWLYTIWFEIPILAIVNQCYFEELEINKENPDLVRANGKVRLHDKLDVLRLEAPEGFNYAEFGTRRRFSYEWQDTVLARLIDTTHLIGTSNVRLAMKHGITPIGTMAHEFFQAGQALGSQLVDSQRFMLDAWVREYRGDLGIALTDTIGIDAFLMDFDLFFAKLYDGLRHDSGNAIDFGEKIIRHYNKLGIDPLTKTLIFSDGLNFDDAFKLHNHFAGRIKTSFGIGTWLTNDVGLKPLNIVLKMVTCNNKPVAKISDSPGKGMCNDEEFVTYLKKVFRERLERKNRK